MRAFSKLFQKFHQRPESTFVLQITYQNQLFGARFFISTNAPQVQKKRAPESWFWYVICNAKVDFGLWWNVWSNFENTHVLHGHYLLHVIYISKRMPVQNTCVFKITPDVSPEAKIHFCIANYISKSTFWRALFYIHECSADAQKKARAKKLILICNL